MNPLAPMMLVKPREIFIMGVTHEGKTFRPSDWAERLAGLMTQFRHPDCPAPEPHLGFSPFCLPTTLNGVRCLVVSETLREIECMAFDFLMNFAKDNNLQVEHACLLEGSADKDEQAQQDTLPNLAAAA